MWKKQKNSMQEWPLNQKEIVGSSKAAICSSPFNGNYTLSSIDFE